MFNRVLLCLLLHSKKQKKKPCKAAKQAILQGFLFGGDKRDRTADLLNAIQALSQLSYTPIYIHQRIADCFKSITNDYYVVNTFSDKICPKKRVLQKAKRVFIST